MGLAFHKPHQCLYIDQVSSIPYERGTIEPIKVWTPNTTAGLLQTLLIQTHIVQGHKHGFHY